MTDSANFSDTNDRTRIVTIGVTGNTAAFANEHLPEGLTLDPLAVEAVQDATALTGVAGILIGQGTEPSALFKVLEAVRFSGRHYPMPVYGIGPVPQKHVTNSYLNLGCSLWLEGHDDAKLQHFYKDCKEMAGRVTRALSLQTRFEQALRLKKQESSMDAVGNLTMIHKCNRNYIIYLAYSHELRLDLAMAARLYHRAASANPGYVTALGMYMILMARCGRWQDTVTAFMKIVDLVGKHYQTVLAAAWWPILDNGDDAAFKLTKKIRGRLSGRSIALAAIEAYVRALVKLDRRDAARAFVEKQATQSEIPELKQKMLAYAAKLRPPSALIAKPKAEPEPEAAPKDDPPAVAAPSREPLTDMNRQQPIGNFANAAESAVMDDLLATAALAQLEASIEVEEAIEEDEPIEATASEVEDNFTIEDASPADFAPTDSVDATFDMVARDIAAHDGGEAAAEPVDYEMEFEDEGPRTASTVAQPATEKSKTRLFSMRRPLPKTPPKLKLIIDSVPPREVRLGQLVTDLKKLWTEDHAAAEQRERAQEPNHRRRIAFFHPQEDASAGYAKLFRDAGFKEIVEFREPYQAFARIRALDVSGIIAFYETERPTAIELLQEMTIARDIEHIPTIVFCTGEETQAEFEGLARDLLYDTATVLQRSRTKMEQLFNSMCSQLAAARVPGSYLEQLHQPWLRTKDTGERGVLDAKAAEDLCLQLQAVRPRSKFADLERMWHAMTVGDYSKAQLHLTKLKLHYPRDFLVDMAEFHLMALEGDPDAVALTMVETFTTRGALSPEMLYQIGRTCDEWAAIKPLGKLVKIWSSLEKMRDTPQFCFIASRFYRMVQDPSKERNYLAMACQADPFRGEYHVGLAEFLFEAKDYKRSYDFWKMALDAAWTDKKYCKARLAEVLVLLRKKSEADSILREILKDSPHHDVALAIRLKYFGGQNAA